MFELKIETGNDAFAEDPAMEIGRILMLTRGKLLHGEISGTLTDANGNAVGKYRYTLD